MGQRLYNLKEFLKVFKWSFQEDYEDYWKYNKKRFSVVAMGIFTVLFLFFAIMLMQEYHIGIFALGGS